MRVALTDTQPPTAWNRYRPQEYGFLSNVNPNRDHPRWSQEFEQLIGQGLFADKTPTRMFNVYKEEIASLYEGHGPDKVLLMEIVLKTELTCPACGHVGCETMPTDTCQFFYDCPGCGKILRPRAGDCCVFCSYGTVPCPPVQAGDECCGRPGEAG